MLVKDNTDYFSEDFSDEEDEEDDDEASIQQFLQKHQNVQNFNKLSREQLRGTRGVALEEGASISTKKKEDAENEEFRKYLTDSKSGVFKGKQVPINISHALSSKLIADKSKDISRLDDSSSVLSGNKSITGSKSVGTTSVINRTEGGALEDDNSTVISEGTGTVVSSNVNRVPNKGPNGRMMVYRKIEVSTTVSLGRTVSEAPTQTGDVKIKVTFNRNPEFVRSFMKEEKRRKKESRKSTGILGKNMEELENKNRKAEELRKLKALQLSAASYKQLESGGTVQEGHCKDCNQKGHQSMRSKACFLHPANVHLAGPQNERVQQSSDMKIKINTSGLLKQNSISNSRKRGREYGEYDDDGESSNLGRTASERKSKSSRHDKPHVAISLLINDILLEIQKNPCSYYYRNEIDRVNAKTYNLMVKNAMFLPTMFKKNEKYGYKNRRDLLNDFQLMIDNSVIYNEANGTKPEHEVTKSAKKMISYAEEMITSKHDRWNKFENQLLTGKIDTEDINDDKSSVFSAGKSTVDDRSVKSHRIDRGYFSLLLLGDLIVCPL